MTSSYLLIVINSQAVVGEYVTHLFYLVGLCHASYGLEIDDLNHPIFGKDMMVSLYAKREPKLI
jgi:hypothetical protein